MPVEEKFAQIDFNKRFSHHTIKDYFNRSDTEKKLVGFDIEIYQDINEKINYCIIACLVTFDGTNITPWGAYINVKDDLEKAETELISLVQEKIDKLKDFQFIIHGGAAEKKYFNIKAIDTESLAHKLIPREKMYKLFSGEKYGLKSLEQITGFKREIKPYFGEKGNYFAANARLMSKLKKDNLEPVVYCLEDALSTLLLYIYFKAHENDFAKEDFLNIPVEIGKEYDIEIVKKGNKGDGIGKYQGYIIFVSGAKPGQTVRARIKSTSIKYGFAEVVK